MADKSQQTEKPTQRKLDKARKEGQFPVSKEFVNGVTFLVFVLLLGSYGRTWLAGLVETSKIVLHRSFHVELTPIVLRERAICAGPAPGMPLDDSGPYWRGSSFVVHLMVTAGIRIQESSLPICAAQSGQSASQCQTPESHWICSGFDSDAYIFLGCLLHRRDNLPPSCSAVSGSRLRRGASLSSAICYEAVYLFMIWAQSISSGRPSASSRRCA